MWLKQEEVLVKNPEALGGPEEQLVLLATAAPRAWRGDRSPHRYHIRGNQPALELAGTESPPYSVFENKDDMASFVKGMVKNTLPGSTSNPERIYDIAPAVGTVLSTGIPTGKGNATVQLVIPWVDIQKLERTANVFVADTIRITTQNKERDSSMFLILYVVLKIMEQLVDVMLRRLLDNELWTPFSRFHTAGRMISSDSSTCFASREDGCYNVVLPLREVVSMEKMEDTSLLPSPILISIRSKMAFQFIELKDRETLEETLLERLKQVHANHPVHYDTSTNDKDMVGACSMVAFCDVTVPLSPPLCQCSDHKFGDLEMVSCHSSKEREDKSPPLHPGHLTVVLQPLGSQNPDSHLVVEATPSLVCHGHWRLGNDHGGCGT
ncbi:TBC1 domain family member 8 [Sciurus carolinensis]|uniref:TBC1 domain family member 8 n=1 Tax=Sciurus carolinensis TaxID=30640 RepID=A0AA41MCG7_SCICA|nr:TBC1 domain family member 8 [Sciurus carolinensis]